MRGHNSLLTRKIVLDSQVFKTNNFNFNARPLRQLKKLVSENRVKVFITDVIEREIKSRMKREVLDSRAWYNELRKRARILLSATNTSFYALTGSLDVTSITDELHVQFYEFIDQTNVEVTDCSRVAIGEILNDYFNLKPPFEEGEKRKEFPDAISLAAIASELTSASGVYVISGDGGIEKGCKKYDGMYYLATVDEFLQLELAEHEDVEWIVDAVMGSEERIAEVISKAFSDGYFFLDDQDGDVNDVTVDKVDVSDITLVGATEHEAELSVSCNITFTADIAYDDPNMTLYDEGERYSFGTVEESVEREQEDVFSVIAEINRVNKTVDDFRCDDTKSRSFPAMVFEDIK